jgi:chaperonin cofactor prefoldin
MKIGTLTVWILACTIAACDRRDSSTAGNATPARTPVAAGSSKPVEHVTRQDTASPDQIAALADAAQQLNSQRDECGAKLKVLSESLNTDVNAVRETARTDCESVYSMKGEALARTYADLANKYINERSNPIIDDLTPLASQFEDLKTQISFLTSKIHDWVNSSHPSETVRQQLVLDRAHVTQKLTDYSVTVRDLKSKAHDVFTSTQKDLDKMKAATE